MEIAVVVSTFERPGLLTRCLASLAAQRGVEGRFEVVVTDDGSQDETRRLRADAIRSLPYPLSLLTSRSSVGRCVRKCHWPGYPQAGGASGTGPRAAQRPRLCRGAFGTRRPVPFSAASALPRCLRHQKTRPVQCGSAACRASGMQSACCLLHSPGFSSGTITGQPGNSWGMPATSVTNRG